MSWIDAIPSRKDGFGTVTDTAREALDAVEALLSQRGTLQAEAIDLGALEEAAMRLLGQAAHVQGFRGAIYAATARGDAPGFETGLRLGLRFLGEDWDAMHPGGKKAHRLRAAAASDIHGMLARAADSLPGRAFDPTETQAGLLAELHAICAEAGRFDPAPFAPRATRSATAPRSPAGGSEATVSAGSLDARGRAELRQDILRLAERIAAFEPEAGIAAQMRGYAAWMEHRALPEHTESGQTVQASLPRQLRDDLLAALQTPTMAGLARLEERLVHSPDWFEGQQAAAGLALALGFVDVAGAIRERVRRRLETQEGLTGLTYPNGEPFVPEAALRWATGPERAGLGAESAEIDPEPSHDPLARLDAELRVAASLREAALSRLDAALGLKAQDRGQAAAALLDGVVGRIDALSVAEWDAPLVQRLRDAAEDGR